MPNDKNDPFAEKSSLSELSLLEELKVLCLPYKGQRWYHQLLLFGGGCLLWLGSFALTITYMGDWAVVDGTSATAADARRRGAIVASVVSSTYFSIALIYAYGGIFLTYAVYPIMLYAAMSRIVLRVWFQASGAPLLPPDAQSLTPRFHAESYPVYVAIVVPYVILLAFAGWRADDEAMAAFFQQWPDIQIRVFVADGYQLWEPAMQKVIRDAGYDPEEHEPPAAANTVIEGQPPDDEDSPTDGS